MKTLGTVLVTTVSAAIGTALYFVLQDKSYRDLSACATLNQPAPPVCMQKLDCNAAQMTAWQDAQKKSMAACDQKDWLRFTRQENDAIMFALAGVFAVAGGIGGYAVSRKL